ncbi:mitogen-activated protein kinase kinase kinase 18-like [Bidens hawaiensis]|uniref:mitogen-activated protein kinase kinase kinase 18-like n=1 Tax=Bidens hawaiensis TaxID=980011 RepID=UPI004049BFB2
MINTPNWVRGVCIGKGSFGTVNLAVNKTNGSIFAVKSAKQDTNRLCQALESEIRILKTLSSNYIVRYLGDDYTKENLSMVYRNLHMEYMPGGTVADLARHGVDEVNVRCYTRCIVSGLRYIHERNIVHCDVKGKNVLIGVGYGVAKLADFGSAMEVGGLVSRTRGSPLWMAPEVVRGEYQGPESDVWSLGCTVIEMITGQPAWPDRGVDSLCQIGYSDELPNFPAHISEELRDFLSKCLRRNRLERWSCDQLLQHPVLLSCSSPPSEITSDEWSPRCVFDWSESNFSDDNTSESENSNVNSNFINARQRIAELSSSSAVNWESDGWELVRNVVPTTFIEPSDFQFTEHGFINPETCITWTEYYDSVEGNDIERTNQEYGDSNGGYDSDDQCTNNYTQSTSVGWNNIELDSNYGCCVYVSLNKLSLFSSSVFDIFIIKFCVCLILDQFMMLFGFIVYIFIYTLCLCTNLELSQLSHQNTIT